MAYSLAVVGATGLVGKELIDLLEKRNFPLSSISFFASKKSIDKTIAFMGSSYPVQKADPAIIKQADIAFFCTSSKVSKEIIPSIDSSTICIDLSSAFRMEENIPLIIPEINGHLLGQNKCISSPNCTTTIMLMALFELHKQFHVKKIIASSYQAASGGGKKSLDLLLKNTHQALQKKETVHPYGFNLFLHDSFHDENFYSEEEKKLYDETKKILAHPSIEVSATCVRVGVLRCHSLSLHVEMEKSFSLKEVCSILERAKGVQIKLFATPADASGKEDVFIGRIRKNLFHPRILEMWVVGDQLYKGAALNALQIAEYLHMQTVMEEK